MSKRPVDLLLDDIIVHEYFGIDLQIVWQILQKDLPSLQEAISQIRG